MSRPDADAFERAMRAAFSRRDNIEKLFQLILPQTHPDGKTLAYILAQSDRFGHLMVEAQALKAIYGRQYRRIVVIIKPIETPGTNPLVRACFGEQFVWVQSEDPIINSLGHLDAGLAEFGPFDLLLQSPRSMVGDLWRRIAEGLDHEPIELPEDIRSLGREGLRVAGVDPSAPFAFLHHRTLKYMPELGHHGYRTSEIADYGDAVRQVLAAGYQVVRMGEPGLDPDGWTFDGYVSLPDRLTQIGAERHAADLTVFADAAFGIGQNSGPMQVASAFGTLTLRSNVPVDQLNLAYNDDLTVFKRYRHEGRLLDYREILDRRLPVLVRDEEFGEKGIDLVNNSPGELEAATLELLGLHKGEAPRLGAKHRQRFLALSQAYQEWARQDPWCIKEHFAFFGYAWPVGHLAAAQLLEQPDYLE